MLIETKYKQFGAKYKQFYPTQGVGGDKIINHDFTEIYKKARRFLDQRGFEKYGFVLDHVDFHPSGSLNPGFIYIYFIFNVTENQVDIEDFVKSAATMLDDWRKAKFGG